MILVNDLAEATTEQKRCVGDVHGGQVPENGTHKHLTVRANTVASHRLTAFKGNKKIYKKENNGKINVYTSIQRIRKAADYKRYLNISE